MEALTHGSLFAGIGGFDLGFERSGIKTIWQVECDPYCLKVLAKHWPDVRRYPDIKTVDWGTVPRPDILSGGFPCQDISHAGKRAGITGSRSGLWMEFWRAIVSLRPRYVVVENVSALYQRGLDTVLQDLAASGYDAEWDCLPAAAIGAPHLRERIFIVAYPSRVERQTGAKEQGVLREVSGDRPVDGHSNRPGTSHISTSDVADTSSAGQLRAEQLEDHQEGKRGRRRPNANTRRQVSGTDVADSTSVHAQGLIYRQGQGQLGRSGWWTTEPAVGRVAHGISHRVDRLKCLGNAVVPQIAEAIGRMIVVAASSHALT